MFDSVTKPLSTGLEKLTPHLYSTGSRVFEENFSPSNWDPIASGGFCLADGTTSRGGKGGGLDFFVKGTGSDLPLFIASPPMTDGPEGLSSSPTSPCERVCEIGFREIWLGKFEILPFCTRTLEIIIMASLFLSHKVWPA